MNDFDRGSRAAVKEEPAGTVRWLFPRIPLGLRWSRWLDSQSAPRPGEPDRRCDTIAELANDEGTGPPWACVIELFTGPDPDALDRAVEYQGRFRQELRHGPHGHDKYPFVFALVFLTGAPEQTRLDMNLPGMPEFGMWFGPRPLDLSDEDGVAHLDAIEQNTRARRLLCWTPLMRNAQREDVAARWRQLVEAEPDEQRRNTQVDLALTFVGLTNRRPVWEKALEGLTMIESSYLRDVRAEATREATLEVLKARFPGGLPSAVEDCIRAQKDVAVLKRWAGLAGTARDLDTFLRDAADMK